MKPKRLRVCVVPGCAAMSTRPRCPVHELRRGAEHRRNSAHLVGSTHCVICGSAFTIDNPMRRGHIVSLEAGGTNDPSNYQAECRRCSDSRAAG
jgi:hypothetical protein